MDHYTIMLVVDATAPVKRFQVPRKAVRRAIIGTAVMTLIALVGLWDYTRMRAGNGELGDLRVEVAEQREQIQRFEQMLHQADAKLQHVRELERKVRIIANLPGAAGVGGEDVTELPRGYQQGYQQGYDPSHEMAIPADGELMPPAGVPIDRGPLSRHAPDTRPIEGPSLPPQLMEREGITSVGARRVARLSDAADVLAAKARERGDSLTLLVGSLEEKSQKLASMPSVWPAKGWLTSRFGARVSPFTGRRQLHAGIDIAARAGTAIQAPARGRVSSVGSRGPLGNSLVIDHGYGLKTFYGHTKEVFVKVGDTVERGQRVAAIGSTGRSTGPHLHYAIHVNGKARDPLNYIFD